MRKKTAPKTGWKKYQHKSKIKKKTKLALSSLALLFILIVLSQVVQIVKFINRPLSEDLPKHYFWNGEFNLNMVFMDEGIRLVSYSPKERKVTKIKIPDETLIDVGGEFGKWQVRAIYGLGGGPLLKQSISNFFGVPVDAYFSSDLVNYFRKNIFSGILMSNVRGDFTPLELLRLKISLLSVRFDKIRELNLEDLQVLEKTKLADGGEVFVADPGVLDSLLSDFSDPEIFEEHLSVAVFNATDVPLLAQRAARIITNLGGSVIAQDNAPYTVEKSYVLGQDSKTRKRLTQIFDLGCSAEPKCDKIPQEDLGLVAARARIIVVLGQDFN